MAASSLPCRATMSRIGFRSMSFHSPPKGTCGAGAKNWTGSCELKMLCMPVTGSQTLMACQVSPW